MTRNELNLAFSRSPLFWACAVVDLLTLVYWILNSRTVLTAIWLSGIQYSGILGLAMCRSDLMLGALVSPVVGYACAAVMLLFAFFMDRVPRMIWGLLLFIVWNCVGFMVALGLLAL